MGILGKIIFPVLIIVSAVQAGAGAERRSREQKRKKKARRNKKLKAPENKVSTTVVKKRKNGERLEDEDGGEEERPSREQLSLASDSVNERTKSLGSERKKIEKKKSSDTHGTHSVASMRRRRERGGCPDRGEGLFPDLTTGCQEFYMCHHGHRMGQFTCPGGTLFSSQHETCDWKGKVLCNKP